MAATATAMATAAAATATAAAPTNNDQAPFDLASLMPTEEDLAYEEELLRNPYSLKTWLRYLSAREQAPFSRRRVLFERAVAALPGSYKLWHLYLSARVRETRSLPPNHPAREADCHAFERALVTMHKMPVLWGLYLDHLAALPRALTRTRRAFDRALASLPLTQHSKHVWPRYLAFVRKEGVPMETAVRVYRRYLQLEPAAVEEFVDVLLARGKGGEEGGGGNSSSADAPRWAEAARRLAAALDDDAFRSLRGRTRHALWLELCDLVTRHPREVEGGDGGTGGGSGSAAGGLDVEAVLRGGIRRHPEESGRLWAALADYFTRKGLFERARDVYEEALGAVATVRDFGLVFDALTHFEESLLTAKMEALDEAEEEGAAAGAGGGDEGDKGGKKGGSGSGKKGGGSSARPPPMRREGDDDESDDDPDAAADRRFLLEDNDADGPSSSAAALAADVDLRLARLELLAARRPELLSSVSLRQNPHSVGEWHRRARLFAGDPRRQVACLTEAIRTVDAAKCGGGGGGGGAGGSGARPYSLWVALAKVYESHGDVRNARLVFERAVLAGPESYRYVDDLAAVWCERVEMELRHKQFKQALALARQALGLGGGESDGGGAANGARPPPPPPPPPSSTTTTTTPVQHRLHRSQRLWALLCDLEESLGDVESASRAYERCMDLKVATPQLVLNYAAMLREHKRWEACFRAYERGVSQLFKFPHAADLWSAYLEAFVGRYGGTKLERARDLFETCLRECPPENARPFYEAYARLEEAHGLARRAMDVYERALKAVPKERGERGKIADLYLSRAAASFGVAKVREVYESAIEAKPPHDLPDADVRRLCIGYAQLEARLGEVDRARAVFAHGAHLADPRLPAAAAYWDAWRAFEVAHGNEDTFREMLRLKRSVAASFATLHVATGAGAEAAGAAEAAGLAEARRVEAEGGGGGTGPAADAMAALEAAAEGGGLAPAPPAPLAAGTRVPGFVSAGIIQQGKKDGEEEKDKGEEEGGNEPVAALRRAAVAAAAAAANNPEEIDLDEEGGGGDEAEEDDGGNGASTDRGNVRQRAVPAAVFGGLAAAAAAGSKRPADDDGGGGGAKKSRHDG